MKPTTRKLGELVRDFDVYPRTQVDSTHVAQMCQADEAGATFPPYVVEAGSLRIVDGFHRWAKDKRLHGPDLEVQCFEKTYPNEGELFLDAMRYNASHGRSLSPFDRARCAIRCKKLRMSAKRIAAALGIPPAALKAIGEGRTAMAPTAPQPQKADRRKGAATPPAVEEVVLKQSIRHMSGKQLTSNQADANRRLDGMHQAYHANQLVLLLESDLIDRENDHLLDVLRKLAARLDAFLGATV